METNARIEYATKQNMMRKVGKCPHCGRLCDVFNAPKMVFGNKLYPAACVYHGIFYRKIM